MLTGPNDVFVVSIMHCVMLCYSVPLLQVHAVDKGYKGHLVARGQVTFLDLMDQISQANNGRIKVSNVL